MMSGQNYLWTQTYTRCWLNIIVLICSAVIFLKKLKTLCEVIISELFLDTNLHIKMLAEHHSFHLFRRELCKKFKTLSKIISERPKLVYL